MSDSTRRRSGGKPGKPSRDFPLFPHQNGYWAKKIRGKLVYFGKWRDDPKGQRALELWIDKKDELLAGRIPKDQTGEATVADAVNYFLSVKLSRVKSNELRQTTWDEYNQVCGVIVQVFGRNRLVSDLGALDFEQLRATFAETNGPVRLAKLVQIVRCIFKLAYDDGKIPEPVRYGQGFKGPSKSVLRCHQADNGERLFSRDEVRRLLDAASPVLRTMILLAINTGVGNTDIGRLETKHLDLAGGWLTFARPKTGVPRRAKLWDETVAGIRDVLASRPDPKDEAHASLIFLTKYRAPWVAATTTGGPITLMFGRLMKEAGVEKRRGRGFYSLRHTYRTIADGCRDQPAISVTMGHTDPSIAGIYRHGVDDNRLEAVADFVHRWLWPPAEGQTDQTTEPAQLRVVG